MQRFERRAQLGDAEIGDCEGAGELDHWLTLAAVVWLVLDLIERRRVARPRLPLLAPTTGAVMAVVAVYAVAGLADGWLLWAYERLLRRVVADTDLDLLHFSLHPLSGARVAVEFALVLLHAAVIWGAATIIRLPSALWRTPRTPVWRLGAASGWLAGALVATVVARAAGPPIPIGPLWVALFFAAAAAIALARTDRQMRRVSQSARLAVFFLALLAPAIAMYPSLLAHATEAKERLVAEEFGPQALSLREDLQRRLQQAVEQIDAIPAWKNCSAPTARRRRRISRSQSGRAPSSRLSPHVGGRVVRPERRSC